MAASKAPQSATSTTTTTTTSVTSTSATLLPVTNTTTFTTTTAITTTLNTSLLSSNTHSDNIHELCRSCGKTNDELYDLFQQQTTNLVTTTDKNANSPFNTSSTTCYTHLSNKTTAVTVGCEKSSLSTSTFDSLAATAKATAKGQSNMDNILQEMQIWQLMIEFNDGLPQRICAKCTAQFYMIHKFRRKCLKVQTQLRTLYNKQQEEQQQYHEQPQQQSDESLIEKDVTIEPTSTPQTDIVTTPLPSTVKRQRDNNSTPNNRKEIEEQSGQHLEQEQHVVDKELPSVSFEIQTDKPSSLPDNGVTVDTVLLKDEKKPLPLESGSLLLTSSQHVYDKEKNTNTNRDSVIQNTLSVSISRKCEENKNEETTLQSNELPNFKDSKQFVVNSENVFITKAALKAYTTTTAASRQTNSNDQNDNACSSTSNLVSPSCSSSTTSISTSKTTSIKINRNKRKRLNFKTNSNQLKLRQKTLVIKSKRKLQSGRRQCKKHKCKRRTIDVKTCSSQNSLTTLKWSRLTHCKPVKKHKTRLRQKGQMQSDVAIQMADESSSSVDSTNSGKSTSSLSSCSPTLSSNAVINLPHKTSSSKKTVCSMWKTKAAMKANTNDLPQSKLQQQQSTTSTSTRSTTTSSLPSSPSSLSTANKEEEEEREENKSLKTPNENHIVSDKKTTTTNKNTTTTTTNSSINSLQHLIELEFKNRDQESHTNKNKQQQPEGEKEKQIEMNTTKPLENDQKTIEIPPANANNEEEQKAIAVVTTSPAKMGCMKLILQRKRGTRFTCRPKNDSDNDDEKQLQSPTTKRRRKSLQSSSSSSFSSSSNNKKLKMFSSSSALFNENDNNFRSFEEVTVPCDKTLRDHHHHRQQQHQQQKRQSNEADENKENPALHEYQQELDADSNLSSYRDPLLIRNDINEEDTNLTDFPQNQLVASLHSECSKEMLKIYKEKVNLESPKKLIVRVPLTSLTQDFKRLHLTMENQEIEEEKEDEEGDEDGGEEEENQHEIVVTPETHENIPLQLPPSHNSNENNENCSGLSSGSDFLGFSQSNNTSTSSSSSSQQSVEMVRYAEHPLCSASSKINDFINDFQNNCIDSSEIEDSNEATLPHLTPRIAQELSDEIRDVEDTLNGILSEMHDKDMYTPRSGTTDEFFAHSVYSPLTDSPTTPSNSFYAESPCTINSNPMSVSPFIHQNMDYNAMTPQSNHSSMGHSSHMSVGNTKNNGCFREHFSSYKECFEESTQSELIGFQNDIPCFENIELGNAESAEDLLTQTTDINKESINITQVPKTEQEHLENIKPRHQPEIVDYIDLSNYKESNEEPAIEVTVSAGGILTPHMTYNPSIYQHPPQNPMQTASSSLISTTTQPHYIVTNTSQGPILIASQGQEQMDAAFKPHSNNLQFITLGQAMEANRQMSTNHLISNPTTTELNWPTTVNSPSSYQQQQQQPVLTTSANGTTTYFLNTNGELYQASIPSTAMQNTILVPPNNNVTQNPAHSFAFNKANNDNNDSYVPAPIPRANTATTPSSQYIMVVNSVTGAPQYFATNSTLNQPPLAAATNIASPATIVYQPPPAPQTTNTSSLSGNYISNSPNPANTTTSNSLATEYSETSSNTRVKSTTLAPKIPTLAPSTDNSNQTMHQRINQQLQRQIKERQQQLLQPRSPNCAQKITLICRFCHKRPKFTNNVDYSNHIINTHPAEKPYNCPHCPINFRRRFERQQHVAQVHGSRYQCAQCGLSFCAQRTLDFHLQKYHANLGTTQQQQNSTNTVIAPATYQLLQQNQQQRLVRVEDVHVQMTDENKNKRSIDLPFESAEIQEVDLISVSSGTTSAQRQQSRKLCCPDCNGDDDNCCGNSNQNHDPKSQQLQQQFVGNESVNNHHTHHHQQQPQPQPQPQHVTIPSPEQTEPDSTTTLRHFRKRQLSEKSTSYTPILSSSTTSSSTNSSNSSINTNNENNHYASASSDINITGDEGVEQQQQIAVECTLRGTHNCLLCEESFTNEIALRKHHHLAHGTQTMATSSATTTSLVCTICKRGFRMRNALQRHMETHNAEGRPYECNICQVRFPRPSQLTLHKLTVHKFEKPNSCDECGKQFGTESAMKAHAIVHEAEKSTTITATTSANGSAVAVASSSSSASSPCQLPSRIYLDTMTTITASTSNSTASVATTATSTTAITSANEKSINLQSSTSGEKTTTTDNNNIAAAAADHVYNNETKSAIVASELTT